MLHTELDKKVFAIEKTVRYISMGLFGWKS